MAGSEVDVDYGRTVRLFTGKYTSKLQARQALALRRIARRNAGGVPLAELEDVCRVLSSALAADPNPELDAAVLENIRLFCKPLVSTRSWQHKQYSDAIGAMLRLLMKCACRETSGMTSSAAYNAIRRFACADLVPLDIPEEGRRTIPVEYSRSLSLLAIVNSGIVPDLVSALKRTPSSAINMQICRDLSLSAPSASAMLTSDDLAGAMVAAIDVEASAPMAVEVIWNLFELHPTEAATRLANDAIISLLTSLLKRTLEHGTSVRHRALRNQVLCALSHLSRAPRTGAGFVRAGCVPLLLSHSTRLELGAGPIASHGMLLEDLQTKKLIWSILGDLLQEPRCVSICAASALVEALLVYTTPAPQAPLQIQVLIKSDRDELSLAAFSLLYQIVDVLPAQFHAQSGSTRLAQLVTHGSNDDLDRIALAVLLRSVASAPAPHDDLVASLVATFTDMNRSANVRADAALVLSRVCSGSAPNRKHLRTSAALSCVLRALSTEIPSSALATSSLVLLTVACDQDARNQRHVIENEGVDIIVGTLAKGWRNRRAALVVLDNLTSSSPVALTMLKESRVGDPPRCAVDILVDIWNDQTGALRSGCAHGADLRSCHGGCQPCSESPGQLTPPVEDVFGPVAHLLARLANDPAQLSPLSPEQLLDVRNIAMYDDVLLANAWTQALERCRSSSKKLLGEDVDVIASRVDGLVAAIRRKKAEAESEAANVRKARKAAFDAFTETMLTLIDQEKQPVEKAAGLVAPIRAIKVKLNKEQKREMLVGALQKTKTIQHMLGDTYAMLYDENVVQSSSYHKKTPQELSPPLLKIASEVTAEEDYLNDVVLGDPSLNEMYRATLRMTPPDGRPRSSAT